MALLELEPLPQLVVEVLVHPVPPENEESVSEPAKAVSALPATTSVSSLIVVAAPELVGGHPLSEGAPSMLPKMGPSKAAHVK